jgi:hypothetical protein
MNDEINILTILFEFFSSILDNNEDDDDTSNLVLLLIKTLFEKVDIYFLNNFIFRFNMKNYIISIYINNTTPPPTTNSVSSEQSLLSMNILLLMLKIFFVNRPYVWNDLIY